MPAQVPVHRALDADAQTQWSIGRAESKIGPLVRLLVQAGAEVEEVRRGKASLEDVFLTLMEEEST